MGDDRRVSGPTVISVAITGSLPQKANNPAVPITPEEQIESTHEAFEAGAALVHIDARVHALSTTRHGVARDRLGELPDVHLRESAGLRRGPRAQHAWVWHQGR